ncbi:MAG TPA: dihydropyrimidinase [Candidatus Limnocylindrales bacterium]|nr:dihydropyrimidinase [Candidatus Limnocylindrales bacterium]
MAAELIVRGGIVVTADGRRQADVAVEGGRIVAVEHRLPESADAREIDASGLLVLPGVIDVHTHTRIATDDAPDRFFQDSVAAAFGGTTTFLSFNNPGTGIDPSRSLLSDAQQWQRRTAGDSAIDYGVSAVVTSGQDDPVSELPALIDAGVATFKAFMVYDFGVGDEVLRAAMRTATSRGGMLEVHCEDRGMLEANIDVLLAEGKSAPRHHAESRPPSVEAAGTRRAIEIARETGATLYVVHLSCAAALDEVRAARAEGLPVYAETCPHYLTLDESRYELADQDCARYVISPPLRAPADRDALWGGLADGSLALVATDHVPDKFAVEKRLTGQPFTDISNGGPGIETLLSVVYNEGVARGRVTVERMVDLLSTTPARLFGLPTKGSIEVGKDADIVLFDPQERRTITQAELHHTSDYTPYEGMAVAGLVRSVLVRGRYVIRDGLFVGQRGFGSFQERPLG